MKDKIIILLVDDSPEDILMYKRHLLKSGDFFSDLEIITADKSQSAIDIIMTNQNIDCMILDYSLPDKTGIELLKEINNSPAILPPTVMLTGQRRLDVAIESLKLGAEDYLIKDELTKDVLRRTVLSSIEKGNLKNKIFKNEAEIKKLAFNDYLTGLPNRASFELINKEVMSRTIEDNSKFAILLIDIDRFKNVNDSYGHEWGDVLIKLVAERVQACLAPSETLIRFSGDEFILFKNCFNKVEELTALADKILKVFLNPFILNEGSLLVTASIGIAVHPLAGNNLTELLRCAEIAMFKAKELGRNQYLFFTEALNIEVKNRICIENELRVSLIENQVTVVFQPIINLDTNTLFALETLVRFNNPTLQNNNIEGIIEIAEQTGQMVQLGDIILDKALSAYKRIEQTTKTSFLLTLNLSAKQLELPNIATIIQGKCLKHDVPIKNIIIELTETAFIDNMEEAANRLNELVDVGASIYIDDFGTGYSSLNLLRTLPISGLKIDKSFVQEMDNNSSDAKLVNSILLLAVNNNLTVIAEGIEERVQKNMLRLYSDVKGQGYYLSRPQKESVIMEFINSLNER